MKAIVQRRYGPPEQVLTLEEVDKPAVEAERALVRVRASSANAGDWRRVRASPRFVRLVEGVRRPKTLGLGGDAAGIVEEVGSEVTHLKPGDEVYGIRTGAFAEYVSGKNFVPKPGNLTFEQAAAVPIAGVTALQAVRDHGKVKPGQRVLVTGAGGGVGTFAVQIARAFGAEVTAVSTTANLEMLRSIGADHVIDRTREDFTRGGRRYDVIIDVGGRPSMSACRRALVPTGLLVRVGAGEGFGGPMMGFFAAAVRSRVLRQRVASFIAKIDRADLVTLTELIEAGKVMPVIDRTYPLSETAQALRYLETERARGKVVITI
jgi:NADPH:quinone reductase-like Zn-dependent oxidoreductase